MASPNLDEITTTTLRKRSKKIADNVSNNTALMSRLRSKGNMSEITGGRVITQELEYDENSTYKRYTGYETFDISPSDVFTAAEFEWKQAAVTVTMSGLEEIQNDGDEAVLQLLTSRIKNAERTFVNNLSSDVYSDGTADGGKQIGGLQLLIPDDPTTGTAGGINRANWSFWRSQLYDFSAAGATPGNDTIQTAMNTLYLQCCRKNDKPDLIVADNQYFQYYWESLQAIQRVTDENMASAGFQNLKYMGADVVFDGGQGGDAPASHMYFLNTDYIQFKSSKKRNIVPMEKRLSTNQDAFVKPLLWAGNMTASNLSLQGVIIA